MGYTKKDRMLGFKILRKRYFSQGATKNEKYFYLLNFFFD